MKNPPSKNCDLGDIDLSNIDIGSYMKEAQCFIEKAMEDPAGLPEGKLREVAQVIVNRAWEDQGYHRVAASLCQYIAMKEVQQQLKGLGNPGETADLQYTFHCSIIESCQLLLNEHYAMRQENPVYWYSFVQFVWAAYRQMPCNDPTIQGLSQLLYDILEILLLPPCVTNAHEIELFADIFEDSGVDLQADNEDRMHAVVDMMRDVFLEPDTDTEIRTLLLPLIELHASKWTKLMTWVNA